MKIITTKLMAKKTAIKLLIRELNRRKKVVEQINDVAAYEFGIAIKIAKRYLVNEKKQIKDAFDKGYSYDLFNCGGKQYYNETYGKL